MFLVEGFVRGNGHCAAAAAAIGPGQHEARLGQVGTVGIVADVLGEEFGRRGVVAGIPEEVARQLEGIFLVVLGPGRPAQAQGREHPEEKKEGHESFRQRQASGQGNDDLVKRARDPTDLQDTDSGRDLYTKWGRRDR